ncbi:MAG: hypothetical protein JRJ75_11030 [Deltaproteobacteria bacterium]|nr:hypothetical protein [Deltaproteobacteria bacterium]
MTLKDRHSLDFSTKQVIIHPLILAQFKPDIVGLSVNLRRTDSLGLLRLRTFLHLRDEL